MKRRNRRKRPSSMLVTQTAQSAGALVDGARDAVTGLGGRIKARLGRRRSPGSSASPVVASLPETGESPAEAAGPAGVDLTLLLSALALLGLGTVLVYSASAVFAQANYSSAAFFLKRHLIYASAGLIALYVGWRIDYRLYQRWAVPVLLLTVVLLIALLIPGLGTRVDGATRWFRLGGISIQPSEPAKIALMIYLAYSLTKKQAQVRSFSIGFLPNMIVAGLVCLLILRQPDLGTTAVLGAVTMLMLLVAGTKLSYILLCLLAAAPVAYQLIVGTPWRLRRLLAFLDPWAYRHDAGYQISESLISIGSGGLYGLGLGNGKQKLFFLPAAHTDFIFAIVGEELGLIGLASVVALFTLLVYRGLKAAFSARDSFGMYLAFGLTAVLGLQALLHMSVVLGLVPTKGITLPLVSYGGSALVTTLFCVGILLNIAARNPEPARFKLDGQKTTSQNRKRRSRISVAHEPAVKEAAGEC